MVVKRFRRRDDARRYLQEQGYVFMGAPDRWRHANNQTNTYAVIVGAGQMWLVIEGSGRGVSDAAP